MYLINGLRIDSLSTGKNDSLQFFNDKQFITILNKIMFVHEYKRYLLWNSRQLRYGVAVSGGKVNTYERQIQKC